MRAPKRGPGLVLVVLALAWPGLLLGQDPGPAAPAPALGKPVPLTPVQGPSPLAWTPPPAPVPVPVPVTSDPGPNGWAPYEAPSAPGGFFFDTEIAVLFPVLKQRITNETGFTPSGARFVVPTVSLDTAVSPKFEIGYRLPESTGLLALSYRFIATQGTGTQVIDGATFNTRTRFNLQVADLDYGTTPFEVAPNYKIAYRIGIRVGDIFFDSQIQNAGLALQGSNTYIGAGPHANLAVERRIEAVGGLSLYGLIDGSVLIGQITQRFHQSTSPDGSSTFSEAEFRHSQSSPNILLQAGLSYVPPIFTNVKLTAGYQFEEYFYLGQFNSNGMPGQSRGTYYSHGVFVRAQIDF